jgi:hypothetical protein
VNVAVAVAVAVGVGLGVREGAQSLYGIVGVAFSSTKVKGAVLG